MIEYNEWKMIDWIINKQLNRVVHYCLVATLYISMIMLYIIAYNSGM
ncbi:hypothetical protein [Paraclostridium bifermentans]|nr:hypothetical protein [Paraclostridium bifermentans]